MMNPFSLPSVTHPCPQKNGTHLGLTWDSLGTHTPLRADGIVSAICLSELHCKGTAFSASFSDYPSDNPFPYKREKPFRQ